jgi:hypothetical protein
MKTPILLLASLAVGSLILSAAQASTTTAPPNQAGIPAPTAYQVVEQGADHRVWQSETYAADANGLLVTNVHKYTELATGLNHLVNGQWVASSTEIDILPDGTAAATNGQHQAYFPGDIYAGQIELVTPDGLHLHSRPVGLSYDDGTNTVMIAALTNSIGQVLGTNQVIYPNAFTGLTADLLYTYTKAGLEQDVILRQQPPTPESLGLNPDTAKIQMLTEFFSPPQPVVQSSTLPPQAGLSLPDQSLDFGTMRMIRGRAFLLGRQAQDAGTRVGKQWVEVDGRTILIEEVPVNAIVDGLAALPLTAMNSGHSKASHLASRHRQLPPQRLAKNSTKTILLAKTDFKSQPGLVLDYYVIDDAYDPVPSILQGDTTYAVADYMYVGSAGCTIEGGSVIKFVAGAGLELNGGGVLTCATSPYRPAILTAVDDNSVGETLPGSTGSPVGTYASTAIALDSGSNLPPIHDLRIAYANFGLNCYNNVCDCQFVNDGEALYAEGNLAVENVLLDNVGTGMDGGGSTINAAFVTGHCVSMLISSGISLNVTNSLFICVTNWGGSLTSDHNYTNSSDAGIFQTVGAGAHYLATNSLCRNAGTTNVDPLALADIAAKTTYPPVFFSNVTVAVNTTLSPQAQRDTDTPDLGYHYDPVDYLLDYYVITNGTLTLANGVAVASYNDAGLLVKGSSSMVSVGSPLYPNWLVRFSSVQEQPYKMLGHSGSSPASGYDVEPYRLGTAVPTGQFRFTKFACPAAGGYHLYHYYSGLNYYGSLLVQDCEFWSGANQAGGSSNAVAVLRNDLFARSTVTASVPTAITNDSLSVTNNLFWNTALTVHASANTNLWSFFNNDFDGCNLGSPSLTVNGNNAYLNGVTSARLLPTNAFDIVSSSSLAYQPGPLGTFYQPANSPLIDAGSTTADQVGLYHYTTQTNADSYEGTSQVDIGYHYAAVDANGNPLDSNGDGIPDYLEDANGNGLIDSGEIGWNVTGDLGLQVIITRPRNGSALP